MNKSPANFILLGATPENFGHKDDIKKLLEEKKRLSEELEKIILLKAQSWGHISAHAQNEASELQERYEYELAKFRESELLVREKIRKVQELINRKE